ncbi:MAG TPA: hypothetical protein ENK91_01395 [Bacteroidetes bacterium]|nr:hypothetical protein [Bacteroidota bacterium]
MIQKYLFLSLIALMASSCAINQNANSGKSPIKIYEKKQLTKYFLWSNGKFVEIDSLKLDDISHEYYPRLRYPAYARSNGIQGAVILSLIIDQYGHLQSAEIKKDIGGGCGKAALDAMKEVFSMNTFFINPYYSWVFVMRVQNTKSKGKHKKFLPSKWTPIFEV